MRGFCLLALLFLSQSVLAEPIKIISGEYAPYSGEALFGRGISTQIVEAVYKEINKDIKIDFVPWKRAMYLLQNSSATGSYPWSKSQEREVDFVFSQPIHEFSIRYFVKTNSPIKSLSDFERKRLCRPNGWNNVYYEKTIKEKKMILESPINIESCLKMLVLGRVDMVGLDEVVGAALVKKYYGDKNEITSIPATDIPYKVTFHFIVAKKTPNAQKIVEEFNHGLKVIKNNGTYHKIVQTITKSDSTKSTCEICNRLGLL